MFKIQNHLFRSLRFWSLGFVSNFVFRASNLIIFLTLYSLLATSFMAYAEPDLHWDNIFGENIPYWFKVDFGEPVETVIVKLYSAQGSTYIPSDYTISLAQTDGDLNSQINDGAEYTTVETVTGNLRTNLTYTYNNVNARYVKIYISSNYKDPQDANPLYYIDTSRQLPPIPTLSDPGTINYSGNYNITWTNEGPSEVTLYELLEDEDSSFATPNTYWPTINTQQITNSANTTFYYKVRSWTKHPDEGGVSSDWSNVESITVQIDTTPPEIIEVLPPQYSSFNEGDIINISVTASDSDGDTLEYQISIDGEIRQTWSISSTYQWQTQVGNCGYHIIKAEVRDNKLGFAEAEIEAYIFRKSIVPPQ